MRLKELESELSKVANEFPSPNIDLEQYPTSAHLASRLVFSAESSFGDVQDKHVLDLGCGTGMLSVASSLLDASSVTGVDCDASALTVARENCSELELENVDFLLSRIPQLPFRTWKDSRDTVQPAFDTVIMNPPFGTRQQGADVLFLTSALAHADVVYSLHKSSTRQFLMDKAMKREFPDNTIEVQVLAQLNFDLPKSYRFHRKQTKDVCVDLIRFEITRS